MPVIRQEKAGQLCGVDGRWYPVIADDRIRNQKFWSKRRPLKHSKIHEIQFCARFDDEFKNGHANFAITGSTTNGACGCIHDLIVEYFPEVEHLIKWHLCSTDGPLHYIASTVYLAGDRDYNGLKKGEPSKNPVHQKHFIAFGNSPIKHPIGKRLREFILTDPEYIVDKVEHKGGDYLYSPKYQFAGMGCKWHECPFDTYLECESWAKALTSCEIKWSTECTKFGEGKERELDSARETAIWPEATDDELMSDNLVLTKLLEARLPKLLEDFKADMENAGFIYSL